MDVREGAGLCEPLRILDVLRDRMIIWRDRVLVIAIAVILGFTSNRVDGELESAGELMSVASPKEVEKARTSPNLNSQPPDGKIRVYH